MSSNEQNDEERLQVIVELEEDDPTAEKTFVCHCSNVCNRSTGRGACICLKNSRKCNHLCSCGTDKMCCTNKEKGADEEDVKESRSTLPSREKLIRDIASLHNDLKGGKRAKKKSPGPKGEGTPRKSDVLDDSEIKQPYNKEWENIRVLSPWLRKSDAGNVAYCIFCKCDLKGKGKWNLFQHLKCKKHKQNALRFSGEGFDQANLAEEKATEDNTEEFKPWLTLDQSTGEAYCKYCKVMIVPGESVGDITSHKLSKRHSKNEADLLRGDRAADGSPGLERDVYKKRELVKAKSAKKKLKKHPHKRPKMEQEEEAKEEEVKEDVQDDDDEDDDGMEWSVDMLEEETIPVSAEDICQQTKVIKANVVSFVVEHNLALDKTDPFMTLLKELPSPGMGIENTELRLGEAMDMVRQTTSVGFLDDMLVGRLKSTLFSIVIDIQTSSTGIAYLVTFVFFRSVEDSEVQLFLLDAERIDDDQSADTIYHKLKSTLSIKEEAGVPLTNWRGFLCETTNIPASMMDSVMALLKPDYPWVLPVVCPSHMGEMSFVPALKVIHPKLMEFCQLLNTHFLSGPKLGVSFLDYRKLCDKKPHPIVTSSNLPVIACDDFLSCLLDQWKYLEMYFREVHSLKSNSDDKNIELMLEVLSEPIMKVLCHVVQFMKGVVATYQASLTKEEPFYWSIVEETTELIRTFGNFFMERDFVAAAEDMAKLNVDNESSYLPLPQMYLGFEAAGSLVSCMEERDLNFEDQGLLGLLQTVREMYKEFIRQLQLRLELIGPVLQLGKVMNPRNLVNIDFLVQGGEELFEAFNNTDLVDVKSVYSEFQLITSNVTLAYDGLSQTPENYWKCLLITEDEACPGLQKVTNYFFTLPLSNASTSNLFDRIRDWNVDAYLKLQTTKVAEYLVENVSMKALMDGGGGACKV